MVAPANNNIDQALEVVTIGGTYVSPVLDQSEATLEPATPAPNGWVLGSDPVTSGNAFRSEPTVGQRGSLWWRYRPVASGQANFDTFLSLGSATANNNDTEMKVYELRAGGIVRALTALSAIPPSSNDAGVGYRASFYCDVVAGKTYYIQVGHFSTLALVPTVPGLVLRMSGPASSSDWIALNQIGATYSTIDLEWATSQSPLSGFELTVDSGPPLDVAGMGDTLTGLAPSTAYEIELTPYRQVGTGHTALTFSAVSHSAAYGGEEGTKATDGNNSTQWTAPAPAPWWLRVDASSPATVVHRYSIRPRTGYSLAAPRSWTFEGSNNGSSWTVMHSHVGSDPTAPGEGEVRSYDVTTPGAFNYYRLNIATNWGGEAWCSISEFVVYGPPSGNSRSYSSSAMLTAETLTLLAPGVPTELNVVALSPTEALMTWEQGSGDAPSGYNVRLDLGSVEGVPVTGGVESYTWLSLTPGQTYNFQVSAWTFADPEYAESDFAEFEFTMPEVPQPLDLSAVPGLTQVTLDWDEPTPTPDGYYVRQGLGPIEDAGGDSYTFTGLTPNTSYTFEVRAYYGMGLDQVESDPVSITVSTLVPAPPINLIGDADLTSILLSWDAPVSMVPDGYYVRIGVGSIEDAGGDSYLFEDLEPGTEYVFEVRAFYGFGGDQVESAPAVLVLSTLEPPYTYNTHLGASEVTRYRVGSAPALRVYLGATMVHEGD